MSYRVPMVSDATVILSVFADISLNWVGGRGVKGYELVGALGKKLCNKGCGGVRFQIQTLILTQVLFPRKVPPSIYPLTTPLPQITPSSIQLCHLYPPPPSRSLCPSLLQVSIYFVLKTDLRSAWHMQCVSLLPGSSCLCT